MNSATTSKRFLVMAGGTGGHVYPALSLAKELQGRGHLVDWLGTKAGIEARLVPEAGISLHTIDVFGIRGKGVKTLLAAPLNLVRALFQARGEIRKIGPSVVVGFGGFASGPGGLAAKLLRIPLVIHEQNARAGTTNKLLAWMATRVLSGFPGALRKSVVVGNPVRTELVSIPSPSERASSKSGPLRILVLGGSLGATFLNDNVAKAIATADLSQSVVVKHQTGARWLSQCEEAYRKSGVKAEILPYIENMVEAYSWADVIVCRSGAMTVSEVAVVGIPALFIPFPYAIDDHQAANAAWLVDSGVARMRRQAELTPRVFGDELKHLLRPREELANLGEAARKIAIGDAARRISDVCEELANVA